jgi:hypothetical protein
MMQREVEAARAKLNFSEWRRGHDAREIEDALKRRMPLKVYARMNAHARLGPSDRIFLMRGLARTIELSDRQVSR